MVWFEPLNSWCPKWVLYQGSLNNFQTGELLFLKTRREEKNEWHQLTPDKRTCRQRQMFQNQEKAKWIILCRQPFFKILISYGVAPFSWWTNTAQTFSPLQPGIQASSIRFQLPMVPWCKELEKLNSCSSIILLPLMQFFKYWVLRSPVTNQLTRLMLVPVDSLLRFVLAKVFIFLAERVIFATEICAVI